MAWGDYDNGGRTSTSAWRRIKQQAKHALPYQCAKCGTGEPLELDHIINHDGTITAYMDGYFIGYIIDYENIGMI